MRARRPRPTGTAGRRWLLGAGLGALGLLGAACGSPARTGALTAPPSVSTTVPQSSVRQVQQELGAMGCLRGSADGVFGYETLAALVRLWSQQGALPDPVFGPSTPAALQQAARQGDRCRTGTGSAPGPAPTSTTPSAVNTQPAPCTLAAITAGLSEGVLGPDISVARVDRYGCSGRVAYAVATYTGVDGIDVTVLLRSGDLRWDIGDRTTFCSMTHFPTNIYDNACLTD